MSMESAPSIDLKVRALQSATTYGEVGAVECIETHFAWIFLTDKHAYKLKKAISFDRMDNSTLDARKWNCAQELELNRRLAPHVYLNVVALRVASGALRIGDTGTVVDWLVKMQRLPAACFLDRAIESRTVGHASVREVGSLLARFYREQPPIAMSPTQYTNRLLDQVRADAIELRLPDYEVSSMLLDVVERTQQTFIESRTEELGRRSAGRIFEAHGDLRPEHVHIGHPPCVIDCLEFDRDLRIMDSLEEIAFFMLECDQLNASWIGREVLSTYCAETGDIAPPEVLNFYGSRRAVHRALIAARHLRDPAVREQADWRALARKYVEVASDGLGEQPTVSSGIDVATGDR